MHRCRGRSRAMSRWFWNWVRWEWEWQWHMSWPWHWHSGQWAMWAQVVCDDEFFVDQIELNDDPMIQWMMIHDMMIQWSTVRTLDSGLNSGPWLWNLNFRFLTIPQFSDEILIMMSEFDLIDLASIYPNESTNDSILCKFALASLRSPNRICWRWWAFHLQGDLRSTAWTFWSMMQPGHFQETNWSPFPAMACTVPLLAACYFAASKTYSWKAELKLKWSWNHHNQMLKVEWEELESQP